MGLRDIPLLHQLALHRPGASRNESFEVIRLIIHMGDQPRPSHAIITAVRATSCGMHLVVAQVIMFDCAVSQGPVAFIWCVLGEDVGLFFCAMVTTYLCCFGDFSSSASPKLRGCLVAS